MSTPEIPFILPKVNKKTRVFEESLVKIDRDELQIGQQDPYPYYSLVTHSFAVAILAITPEGEYVLIEEYRHPTGSVLLSCPAGYIDPGESPLQAAKRELLEETGFQAETYELIGKAFPFTGFSGQATLYVRAKNASFFSTPQLEKSEIIRSYLVKPKDLDKIIDNSTELDGTLCTALYFNQRNR